MAVAAMDANAELRRTVFAGDVAPFLMVLSLPFGRRRLLAQI